MPAYPWFRLYSETIDDLKLRRVARESGQSKALVLGVWAGLLCMASRSPERGVLLIAEDMPMTREEIRDELDLDEETFGPIFGLFVQYNMIGYDTETTTVTHWLERQYDKPSDRPAAVRERVRKHRAKSAESDTAESRNADVTPLKRESNATDTDTDTDTESEAEASGAAEAINIWSQMIGKRDLSDLDRDLIDDAINTYGVDRTLYALQTAYKNNAFNWVYVEAVLENKRERYNAKRENGNGARASPATAPPPPDDALYNPLDPENVRK